MKYQTYPSAPFSVTWNSLYKQWVRKPHSDAKVLQALGNGWDGGANPPQKKTCAKDTGGHTGELWLGKLIDGGVGILQGIYSTKTLRNDIPNQLQNYMYT